mmetsp:Transcript_22858/g.44421  ORF Transcript_22858/g.44421 Transcript_22858/m.44421 type:complete len:190 (+) Transcript_22858:2-571(+)
MGGGEAIMKLLLQCISQARENEKHRTLSDMRVHDRLQELQREMRNLLTLVRERGMAQEAELAAAHMAVVEKESQIAIPLHEQVEDYVVALQQKLADAQVAKEEAFAVIDEAETMRVTTEQRAEALGDWMKTMKSMQKLAAFSKRKINKAYSVSKAEVEVEGIRRMASVEALSGALLDQDRLRPRRMGPA